MSNYPQCSWKIIVWAIATFFTLSTEAWALFLLSRWSHISVLEWVIPEASNLSCITMAQNCSPPQLVHLHTSTGGSAKYCDLLPSNMGLARAVSFGETPLWQDTASSMLPPAAHCATQWAELWFARRKVEVLETSSNSLKLRTSSSTESHKST